MSVWADGLWMLGDGDGLADELVALLADTPGGLSGHELARRVKRRRADVLAALRVDVRVEHDGRTRGSRWRLRHRAGPNGNRPARDDPPWAELDPAGIPAVARGAESGP